MLKWAVGVHRAGVLAGASGAPTASHAPTPLPAAARRARKHQRIGDKENATLTPDAGAQSPRRGGDALRDVSNTASPTPPGRRKRPAGAAPSADGPGAKRANRRRGPAADPPTPPPSSPLVDYSPCPLREAQSLLALRRRLFEASPMSTPLLEAFDRWRAASPLPCWLPDHPFPPYGTNGRYLKGLPDADLSVLPGYRGDLPIKSEAAATPAASAVPPAYGLTLPTGIPSPESPDATPSVAESTLGAVSTKRKAVPRRRKTSSCVSGELDLRISNCGPAASGSGTRLLVHGESNFNTDRCVARAGRDSAASSRRPGGAGGGAGGGGSAMVASREHHRPKVLLLVLNLQLRVSVIRGTNLCRPGGDSCNAYVKVRTTLRLPKPRSNFSAQKPL